jgi:F420 biosynthesis protein FbiB-like protein
MNIQSFLQSRRSVRRFRSTPVSKDVLVRILETTIHAPSAHNRQPWRFAVIDNQKIKFQLSQDMAKEFRHDLTADGMDTQEIESRLSRSISRINNAPIIIILCMDMSEMDVYSDEKGLRATAERTMAIQSTAAAGLQLQLAALSEGLDTVWTCGPLFTQETVKRTLGLEISWEPQAMFFLGYADEKPKEKILKPLEEVVKFL